MSDRVWMQVNSMSFGVPDDQRIRIDYSTAIDMVCIDVGSGSMYIPVAMAAGMVRDFTAAVETALRAQVPVPPDPKAVA